MKVFFQTIGLLFEFNLGLTSQLAAYKDTNVTIGTRHLLLYVYGIGYTQHFRNLKIRMITFPTAVPFKPTLYYGSAVSSLIVKSSLFKNFISRFDIVHLNDRSYPYTKAAVKTRKRTLLTLHWIPSKIDEDTFSKLDALVAPSETVARITKEKLGIKPKVIYHGVNSSLFNTQITQTKAREYLGLPQGRKVILWNGRMEAIKDPKTLIDAIPIVAKEIPDSLFLIKTNSSRNSGILKNARKLIKKTGTEQNVIISKGWDFITKMPYFYRSADVHVHTSLSECCSFVLIEAMACGIPIISTNISVVSDPVGNSGLRFEPKDPEDLADKIIKLLSNEKLRTELSEKGLRRVSELGLTWEKAAERYRDLYLSLM